MSAYKLHFPPAFDGRAEFECVDKGWLGGCLVFSPSGRKYEVTFMDLTRLNQDAVQAFERGDAYFTEPGLLIVRRVDREQMEFAVQEAARAGYFERQGTVGSSLD